MQPSDPSARFLLVVDAPSKTDNSWGEFGSGKNGDIIRLALRQAGIDVEDVGVIGATRCFGPRAPIQKHLAACKPFLWEDIKEIDPEVIITMGAGALQSVLNIKGVTANRGSVFDIDGRLVVPTFSPGVVFHSYGQLEFIANDMRKALMAANGQLDEPEATEAIIVRDIDQLVEVADQLMTAEMITFDIETTGLNPLAPNAAILCVSFSDKPGRGYVVPLHGKSIRPVWNREDEEIVIDVLKEILASPVKKIASNGKFDARYLETVLGARVENFFFDCQLGYAVIHEERPHNLEHLRTLFTQMRRYDSFKDGLDRAEKKLIEEVGYAVYDEETLWTYAAADADVEFRVALVLMRLIEEEGKGAGGAFKNLRRKKARVA